VSYFLPDRGFHAEEIGLPVGTPLLPAWVLGLTAGAALGTRWVVLEQLYGSGLAVGSPGEPLAVGSPGEPLAAGAALAKAGSDRSLGLAPDWQPEGGNLAGGGPGAGICAALVAALAIALVLPGLAGRKAPDIVRGTCWVALAFLLALALGIGLALWRLPREGAQDLAKWAPLRLVRLQAVVATDPVASAGALRFEAEARLLLFPRFATASGRVRVTWPQAGPRTARQDSPRLGDSVLVSGALGRIEPATNPGQPDFAHRSAARGIYSRIRARQVSVSAPESSFFNPVRAACELKSRAAEIAGSGLPPPQAALVGSLLFGAGVSPVDSDTRWLYTDLGLAHILAASGMQVTLLVGMTTAFGRAIGAPGGVRAALSAGLAALYSAMCGFAPSVLRAAWMSGAALLADATGRPSSGRRALWLSALVLIAWSPALAMDLGFQFSFLATWGLLTTTPWLADRVREWLRLPRETAGRRDFGRSPVELLRTSMRARAYGALFQWRFVALSLAIDAAVTPLAPLIWCTPLQMLHFAKLSAWSLPANWLADGIVVYLTYMGFALTVLGLAWAPLAQAGTWLLGIPLAFLESALRLLHALPGAVIPLLPPPAWAVALSYLALCVWHALRMPGLRQALPWWPALRITSFLSAFASIAFGSHVAAAPSGRLEVAFLDVGQGDAILVRGPRGSCALVDAGPDGPEILLPAMRRMGCSGLDLVALTHPHGDHMGGMTRILGQISVHEVWDAGQSQDSAPYRALLAGVLALGAPLVVPGPGQSRQIDGVTWTVLAPATPRFTGTRSDCNNDSLVIGLEWGATRILLAGDLEAEGEHRLVSIARPSALRADVLKAPHHGSQFGSTPEFLAAVRPKASVISVGRQNAFGHPDPDVLKRLGGYGPVFRTDRHGAIVLVTSPATWSIRPFQVRSGAGGL
jgi:competence protein ComEC